MKILAFSGKIGSGKDYLAEHYAFNVYRQMNKNVMILAFADYLKLMCIIKDKMPYDKVFLKKDEHSRRLLQLRGDKERTADSGIFIKVIENTLKLYESRGVDVTLITDLRFKDEFECLKNLGATLIRVNAPRRTRQKMMDECDGDLEKVLELQKHRSETDLDDEDGFHYIINNDISEDGDDSELHVLNDLLSVETTAMSSEPQF